MSFSIGDKVRDNNTTEIILKGKVVGFGFVATNEIYMSTEKTTMPVVLVQLDDGAFLDNKNNYHYVSIITVSPDLLEKVED